MRVMLAYVAAIVGAGLTIRGVMDAGLGFLAASAALIAWRVAATPLRKVEVAVVAALTGAGAAQGHWIEGAGAAAIVVSALELMRFFR
jgi:hypothetical protein